MGLRIKILQQILQLKISWLVSLLLQRKESVGYTGFAPTTEMVQLPRKHDERRLGPQSAH